MIIILAVASIVVFIVLISLVLITLSYCYCKQKRKQVDADSTMQTTSETTPLLSGKMQNVYYLYAVSNYIDQSSASPNATKCLHDFVSGKLNNVKYTVTIFIWLKL